MTIPSWAVRGAMCVCILDDWDCRYIEAIGLKAPTRLPMLNEVLTIYMVTPPNNIVVSWPVLYFEETGPYGYAIKNFRPLVTRTQEQDVRALKSMLRDMPAESRLDRLLEALDE